MSNVESFCPERTVCHLAAALNLLSWPYSSGSEDDRIVEHTFSRCQPPARFNFSFMEDFML